MKAVVLKQLTHPASAVRLIRMGCVNRPFYQIGVSPFLRRPGLPPDEVIGSFDPVANEKNEKLVAVDLDRLAYWMGEGAHLSQGVVTVLGLVGFLPISRNIYMTAWKNRTAASQKGLLSESTDV